MHKRTGPWAFTLAIVFALTAIGCAATEEAAAPAEEPAAEEPMGLDASVLADPARPEDEVAQDEHRKALDVYAYFGVEPGMTVADLWPGAGYNTALLSPLMGEGGHVYGALHFYNDFNEGAVARQYRERVTEAGYANVTIVDQISEIPADTLDVAIAVRNYHDVVAFEYDHMQAIAEIFAAMKPGGIVGIVEVATPHEGWHDETHRLNEQTVIDHFTAGGFELVDRSDMLANPDDDHSGSAFDTGRYKADRYVLKFRKPEASEETTD